MANLNIGPKIDLNDVTRSVQESVRPKVDFNEITPEVREPAGVDADFNEVQVAEAPSVRATGAPGVSVRDVIGAASAPSASLRPQAQPVGGIASSTSPTSAAEIAGLATPAMPVTPSAPAEAQRPAAGRVPVMRVPDVTPGAESSRDPGNLSQTTRDAAAVGAEFIDASMNGIGTATAPVIPSTMARATVDERRAQASEDAHRVSEAAASPDPETQAAVGPDRPSSIFSRSFGWNGGKREPRFRQASFLRPRTARSRRSAGAASAGVSTARCSDW